MQKQKIDKFQFCHSNFAEHFEAQPPCSAYSVLTDAGVLQDPYFGEREEEARVLSDGDCWFTADFTPEASFMNCEHLLLCLNGIDTVSEIYLNGVFLGKTDNTSGGGRSSTRSGAGRGCRSAWGISVNPIVRSDGTGRPRCRIWGFSATSLWRALPEAALRT